MKKILIILVSAFVLWKVVGLSIKEYTYQKAIDCIENGDYNQAVELIENMYDYSREGDYFGLKYYVDEKDVYRETLNIYAYALTKKYEQEGESASLLDDTIRRVEDHYRGPFCEEIEIYSEKVWDMHYDEILQKEEEERKRHRTKLPYVGMKRIFISDTLAGEYTKEEKTPYYYSGKIKYYNYRYYWYKYGELVMIVYCKGPEVVEVEKFYRDELWTEPGQHTFSSLKIIKPERHYPEFKGDMYNVYDYDDPEDFYFDYEDDFDGYEDAEEYFDEAWDN